MKKLLCGLLFLTSSSGLASYSTQTCNIDFNENQLNTMTRAYHTGKADGLGYTLAAIAWRETLAGENVVNYRGQLKNAAMGAFQNKIETVGSRENCTTHKCYANIGVMLITDQEYAANMALIEIKDWLRYHKGNKSKSLSSYNSGFKHNKFSINYAKDVIEKEKYIKSCVNFQDRPIVNNTSSRIVLKHKNVLDKLAGVNSYD